MVLNKCFCALALLAASSILVSGCAGTACDKAADHTATCFDSKGSGGSGGNAPGAPIDCSGAIECQANCYNQYDCSVIKDLSAGKPAGKPLADCLTECGTTPTS